MHLPFFSWKLVFFLNKIIEFSLFLMLKERLLKRHAGVLGLACCVKAFPYDVPNWLPEMIIDLGNHLHDPIPIEVSLFCQKRVLSSLAFKTLKLYLNY
jgi:hypothetical protein